jgi:hypothetical protein
MPLPFMWGHGLVVAVVDPDDPVVGVVGVVGAVGDGVAALETAMPTPRPRPRVPPAMPVANRILLNLRFIAATPSLTSPNTCQSTTASLEMPWDSLGVDVNPTGRTGRLRSLGIGHRSYLPAWPGDDAWRLHGARRIRPRLRPRRTGRGPEAERLTLAFPWASVSLERGPYD